MTKQIAPVVLTPEEEAQIKAFIERGDREGARRLVLEKLETEFGDSNNAGDEMEAKP